MIKKVFNEIDEAWVDLLDSIAKTFRIYKFLNWINRMIK